MAQKGLAWIAILTGCRFLLRPKDKNGHSGNGDGIHCDHLAGYFHLAGQPIGEGKIMVYQSCDELRGYKKFPEQPKKTWWQVALDTIFMARALRRENAELRSKLLTMSIAAEDAGRIGLMLYEENELLREQSSTEQPERLVRLHDLDALANENSALKDKLKRSYDDYNRLHEQVNAWTEKFGEKGK